MRPLSGTPALEDNSGLFSRTPRCSSRFGLKLTRPTDCQVKRGPVTLNAPARRFLVGFNTLMREADFSKVASKLSVPEVDLALRLRWMFNAYFVTEAEFLALGLEG